MIGAILQIIASILRLIPGWREKRIDQIEGEWRKNNEAIDTDLGPKPWWVRYNDTIDEDKRSGNGSDAR
ncbi:MAG: hypothetical protein EB116_08875 [Betaproteobacteria bacterium]|nr:hypothetical protein [Betaproteobacteria bacterium]